MEKEIRKKRLSIDRYTNTKRKKRNIETADAGRPVRVRLRRYIERVFRKMGYALIGLLFRQRKFKGHVPLGSIQSVLIFPYGDAIGDLIAALPIARAIKRRHPACRIGIITSERNESLIAQDTDIDRQYLFTGRKDLKRIGNLLRARREKYDLIINCHF